MKSGIAATTAATVGLPLTDGRGSCRRGEKDWQGQGHMPFLRRGLRHLVASHNGKIVATKRP
jgi:hypothetical protein